jgi:hypothetical protein
LCHVFEERLDESSSPQQSDTSGLDSWRDDFHAVQFRIGAMSCDGLQMSQSLGPFEKVPDPLSRSDCFENDDVGGLPLVKLLDPAHEIWGAHLRSFAVDNLKLTEHKVGDECGAVVAGVCGERRIDT